MEDKTFVTTEEQYCEIFAEQFKTIENAKSAWDMIDKPKSYPCVVVKSCAKYIYVYDTDLNPFREPGY